MLNHPTLRIALFGLRSFVCVLDIETNKVTFVNAGHNKPFIRKKDDKFVMYPAKRNLVLGLMEDIVYKEQEFMLEEGDCLYLYTDGVSEALNINKELLGDARLEEMLNRHTDDVYDVDLFVQDMFKEVDDFAGEEIQADDITMLYLAR